MTYILTASCYNQL